MAADVGTGSSITFSTAFFNNTITNIQHTGLARKAVDVSEMQQTEDGLKYIPSRKYEPGQFEIEGHFDETMAPPITGATEVVTLTFPSANTFQASGFLTEFETTVPFEEDMTYRAVIKLTGDVTF